MSGQGRLQLFPRHVHTMHAGHQIKKQRDHPKDALYIAAAAAAAAAFTTLTVLACRCPTHAQACYAHSIMQSSKANLPLNA
eukprot:1162087-Pelagomonas_calceolata.AAC.15